LNEQLDDLWREALSAQVSRDLMWTKQSRRGRWVVVEPAPALPGQLPHVRAIVAAVSERRGRRFSSLSRARAFARQVDGRVVHWRAQHWKRISPWQRAAKHAGLGAMNLVRLAQLEVVP
jgi:hypothetical protein